MTHFQAWSEHKESGKLIKINLGADYNVAMILIVNKIERLSELVDFEIGVGKYTQTLLDVKISFPETLFRQVSRPYLY